MASTTKDPKDRKMKKVNKKNRKKTTKNEQELRNEYEDLNRRTEELNSIIRKRPQTEKTKYKSTGTWRTPEEHLDHVSQHSQKSKAEAEAEMRAVRERTIKLRIEARKLMEEKKKKKKKQQQLPVTNQDSQSPTSKSGRTSAKEEAKKQRKNTGKIQQQQEEKKEQKQDRSSKNGGTSKSQEEAKEDARKQRKKEEKRQQQQQQQHEKEEQKHKAQVQKQRRKEKEQSLQQRKKEDPTFTHHVPKWSAVVALRGLSQQDKLQRTHERNKVWSSTAENKKNWTIPCTTFDGNYSAETINTHEIVMSSIQEGIHQFNANPALYLAVTYPSNRSDDECDTPEISMTYILREGTVRYQPHGLDNKKKQKKNSNGPFVLYQHVFQRLVPYPNNILPTQFRDKYTDHMTYKGQKLHDTKSKLPLLPGRGMGLGDDANMTLLGGSDHLSPNDICQGTTVGNCWLLSSIACVADYEWAVTRLFRHTPSPPHLHHRPCDRISTTHDPNTTTNEIPTNSMVVTLWDLTTWHEVDIVIDERLPIQPLPSSSSSSFRKSRGTMNVGRLLGAQPSRENKFWVPYLEKALAIHCGGYDKLIGGNCSNAWPMLTGSRNQYIIQHNPHTNLYTCCARYNPSTEVWSGHTNSPHDYPDAATIWTVNWPLVGGTFGGTGRNDIPAEVLFHKMVAWNDTNYLLGAGTSGRSDHDATDGLVDNHAYSVIDSRQNIAGTGIDLVLVRNPWGKGGGLSNGEFMTNGTGWKQYPKVRYELDPIPDDTGLFWLTKTEFFTYFPTIYLCKFNMARLRDKKGYVNDLQDEFPRCGTMKNKLGMRPKKNKVARPVVPDELPPLEPWFVNKRSDPHSPYKVVEHTYNGTVTYIKINKDVKKGKSIPDAVEQFRSNPEKYLAIHFQSNIIEEGWPVKVHQYTLIYRNGSKGIQINIDKKGTGSRTLLTNILR